MITKESKAHPKKVIFFFNVMYMYPHPITSIDATTQFKNGNILLLDTLQKECVKISTRKY